jgi:hypothetical protein
LAGSAGRSSRVVAFDITSFWALAWSVHKRIPARIFVLFCGLVVTGIYYLVAKLTGSILGRYPQRTVCRY